MLLDTFLILLALFLLLCVGFWTYLLAYLLYYRVPLISTNKKTINQALKLANVQAGENVVELGCGWAPFLFSAARVEPRAHYAGYDVLWPVLALNRWRARGKINFVRGDFFAADLSQADVVYCYLWDTVMERLHTEKWAELKPGTRLVSYDFPIKKLTPNKTAKVGRGTVYLYVKA